MSALISFLGGGVFRMVWGEVSHYFTAKQEHQQEIERLELQDKLDASQQLRVMDSLRLQAELGVKTIEAQAEAAVAEVEADGWLETIKGTTKAVGIAFVDAWNAMIRPGVATWSIIMMTLGEFAVVHLSENTIAICSAAL